MFSIIHCYNVVEIDKVSFIFLFRSVADRFGMGKSSLSNCFMRVIEALNDIADDIIVWPTGDKLLTVKEKFRKNGFA